jgi:outer membrane protein TolC
MIVRRIALLLLLTAWLPAAVAAAGTEIKLTLNEAIRLSAERNLDVRAELYNPAQFEAEINRNRGIYNPLLTAQTSYDDVTNANVAAGTAVTTAGKTLQLNAGISQLFWTGATLSGGFTNAYNSTDRLGDYWQSTLSLTLNQPLLKNAGREVTESAILVSRLAKYASIEKFNARLLATVAAAKTEYYKLYNLREQLEVRKVSLDLARKILHETKARVAAGVLPAMEILNAEFGAASREKDLIDAEKAVRDQVEVLQQLLQLEARAEIIPVDQPRRDLITISENDSVQRILDRPDIREQKRNLEIAELQTRVFRNKTRPDLALFGSVGANGLDHEASRDLEKMVNGDAPMWGVGLSFTYPLGNDAAENDYRKSRLRVEQTALQIRNLEESAANEVRAAIRGVTSGYKQIDVADRGRSFAEERLRAFVKKNEVGLATTKDVLDVENDLATAKSNQIAAVVNYNNAIVALWKATGELLERDGIHVVESDADKLYTKTR